MSLKYHVTSEIKATIHSYYDSVKKNLEINLSWPPPVKLFQPQLKITAVNWNTWKLFKYIHNGIQKKIKILKNAIFGNKFTI